MQEVNNMQIISDVSSPASALWYLYYTLSHALQMEVHMRVMLC